ncbi:MAG: HAMP domain-containing histidine kinase [Ignavibacteria bacterium]|nr:HAMP domain-containing histidine kinase [Ignavibacteria bacterium]
MKKKSKKINLIEILNEGAKNYDMIIITDKNGKVELYNKFLSQLCNSANKDEILLTDIHVSELFKPTDGDFAHIINEIEENGSYNGDVNFRLSYNQLIPFEMKAFKVNQETNNQFNYIFLFKMKDVDEFEKDPLEQKVFVKRTDESSKNISNYDVILSLDELEKLKENFLSSISHELRTPLASIIGFTETLKNDPNLPKEIYTEFLDIILEEGKRLAATINDLLDVSQLYKNQISLQLRNVELQELVEKSYEQFKPLATNIEFSIQLPEKPIIIVADENKLQQAINNLVSNAIKFTPEGGRVKLTLYETKDNHVLEVSDTGIGIPEKDKDKIFDRFYRVYRPGKEIRGVGLGLSITKKILDLHGFKLVFESQENVGSTFKILFPK